MAERTVWKYVINLMMPARTHAFSIPTGRIVHCGKDPRTGCPALWIEVDPAAPVRPRRFAVVGTGAGTPLAGQHVGSAICDPYVWHVYELPASPSSGGGP